MLINCIVDIDRGSHKLTKSKSYRTLLEGITGDKVVNESPKLGVQDVLVGYGG